MILYTVGNDIFIRLHSFYTFFLQIGEPLTIFTSEKLCLSKKISNVYTSVASYLLIGYKMFPKLLPFSVTYFSRLFCLFYDVLLSSNLNWVNIFNNPFAIQVNHSKQSHSISLVPRRQTVIASFPAPGWKGGTVKGLMHRPFIQAVKASSASSSAIKARAKAEVEWIPLDYHSHNFILI